MTPTEEREELIYFSLWVANQPCDIEKFCIPCEAVRVLRVAIGFPYKKPDMCTYEQFEEWEKSK